jgi:hypothetical protein
MPIPPEFNGDLFLWFNQVVGDLGTDNSELFFIRKYWASLTAAQRTTVKTAITNRVTTAVNSLNDIKTEITGL